MDLKDHVTATRYRPSCDFTPEEISPNSNVPPIKENSGLKKITKYFREIFRHGRLLSVLGDYCSAKEVAVVGKGEHQVTKVYTKRFWMLFLFVFVYMFNNLQAMQYSVITSVVECYYNVSVDAVNWTLEVFLLSYIVMVVPSTFFLNRYGLRATVCLGAFCNAASVFIQCFTEGHHDFALVMLSQVIASMGQNMVVHLPAMVASTWFESKEVCRATSIGVLGGQLGFGLGFLFTSLVVPRDCSKDALIRRGRRTVTYTATACNFILLLLVLTTFEDKPDYPPSTIEVTRECESKGYRKTIKAIMTNSNFILLLIDYGIITGMMVAFGTILDETITPLFQPPDGTTGWMGLLFITAGIVAFLLAGYILDRTHKFKELSTAYFVCCFLSMVAFSGCVYINHLWVQYITVTILGFFMAGYMTIGYQFAAEITYPESEGISSAILTVSQMAFAMILTSAGSALLEKDGILFCNLFFSSILLVACGIIISINCDQKRIHAGAETDGSTTNCEDITIL